MTAVGVRYLISDPFSSQQEQLQHDEEKHTSAEAMRHDIRMAQGCITAEIYGNSQSHKVSSFPLSLVEVLGHSSQSIPSLDLETAGLDNGDLVSGH